jgi:hypothetical protein
MNSLKQQDFSSRDVPKPLIVADPTKGVTMNASVVAQPFRDEIRAKIAAMKEAGLGAFQDSAYFEIDSCAFLPDRESDIFEASCMIERPTY